MLYVFYKIAISNATSPHSLSMPGRAKSETKKAQDAREEHSRLEARAIEAYKLELQKPKGKGARTIATEFTELYKVETGRHVKISYQRLIRDAKGERSRAESNASRGWLTDSKVDVVIGYIMR